MWGLQCNVLPLHNVALIAPRYTYNCDEIAFSLFVSRALPSHSLPASLQFSFLFSDFGQLCIFKFGWAIFENVKQAKQKRRKICKHVTRLKWNCWRFCLVFFGALAFDCRSWTWGQKSDLPLTKVKGNGTHSQTYGQKYGQTFRTPHAPQLPLINDMKAFRDGSQLDILFVGSQPHMVGVF